MPTTEQRDLACRKLGLVVRTLEPGEEGGCLGVCDAIGKVPRSGLLGVSAKPKAYSLEGFSFLEETLLVTLNI